jgi:Domain of unknown function (DUF5106)/Domain of unknown function (DUF4369)/Thioredoxin-like
MKKLLIIVFTLLGFSAIAQNKTPQKKKETYRIEVQIKGIKDTTCYLGNYFFSETSGKFYVQDTAKVDSQGRMVFEGDTTLARGLYIITVPKKGYFDFLLTDQHFSIETDTTDFVGNMKIVGSRENELFNGFRREMSKRYQKMTEVNKQRKEKGEEPTNEALKALQKESEAYQESFMKENDGTFVVKLIKANQSVKIPDALQKPKNRADSVNAFNYYKDHFLDNVDFKDEAMLRTPFFGNKILGYISFAGTDSDSLNKYADNIIHKTDNASKRMRKTVIWFITNKYESGENRLMGTEGLFVHMAKKYYIGEPSLWDTASVRRMKERIATLEPVLLGKQVKNIYACDSLGKYTTPLYDVKSKYTVLFIFDPNCGHCKEKAPKLVEWYNKSKYKNLASVYTISGVQGDQGYKDWKKFVPAHFKGCDPKGFINTFDYKNHVDFKNWFDVIVFPVMYLLDKDKKIVGRGIGVDDLENIIEMREKMDKVEQASKKSK